MDVVLKSIERHHPFNQIVLIPIIQFSFVHSFLWSISNEKEKIISIEIRVRCMYVCVCVCVWHPIIIFCVWKSTPILEERHKFWNKMLKREKSNKLRITYFKIYLERFLNNVWSLLGRVYLSFKIQVRSCPSHSTVNKLP
jgi:hypothetical protein